MTGKKNTVLVGITPDTDDGSRIKTRTAEERIIYLWDGYARAVVDAGALAVVLPVSDEKAVVKKLLSKLDGLVLAGGNFDVPPEYYGEEPRPCLGALKPERSWFERELLREAMRRDVPVLGICGGMQIINVAFGGTLYQDIGEDRPGSREHRQKIAKDRTSHSIKVAPGTVLALAARSRTLRVNSTHHQGVKDVGRGLVASGVSPDGLVEAVESGRHRFIVGVQFHPELLYKKYDWAARLFKAFVLACKKV